MIAVRTAPKSDQINADDLAPGQSLLLTVTAVRPGPDEKQAIDIVVAESPRVYRPCLTMRRVLVACWGGVTDGQLDPAVWVGRRLELYTDPTVRFGSDLTGGLRIRALSGISRPMTQALTTTRGKRAVYTVGVLPDAPARQEQATSPTPPIPPTELPKFVSAVGSLAAGLTVPVLREYLALSGVQIDTLTARELAAVVADLRAPTEIERLTTWLASRPASE